MATVPPGSASTVLFPGTGLLPSPVAECPFCRALNPYEIEGNATCVQIPCGSCGNNLVLLPDGTAPDASEAPAPPIAEPIPSAEIPVTQRRIGIAVAALAGLLNYVVMAALVGAMFAQAKQTHDPYDIDESLLSPLLLRSTGWTPLHLAAARGDLETANTLLAEGASIEAVNDRGRTPLYEASKRGRTAIVALLLKQGANPNVRGVQGFTPLLAAAERGHADTITLLAAKGAKLTAKCDCGDSALHRAVRQGHLAAAQALIEHGINVNQKSHGQTALELAEENEDEALIALLRTHGGKEFKVAKAHFAKGFELQNKGLYDAALMAYAEALSLDPDYPEAYFNRGTALIQKGSLDEALIAFRTAMDLNPLYMDAYGKMAWIHAQRKQLDQGLALWDGYLTLQPKSGHAYYERSFFKRAKGDAKGFMDDLQKACTLGYQKAC